MTPHPLPQPVSAVSAEQRQQSEGRTAEWLISAYTLLDNAFGDLRWWPGDSPFEIIVGAILTQNTAWRNVEKAIQSLKDRRLFSLSGILATKDDLLAEAIRSSGCFHVKAKRLKAVLRFIQERYDGHLDRMFAEETFGLRQKLLAVHGIGEETADSILLYAGQKPVFVVDAYTRRILQRHGLITPNDTYGAIQDLFMNAFPEDVRRYNQYHALIVETGKRYCRKKPLCTMCPLRNMTI